MQPYCLCHLIADAHQRIQGAHGLLKHHADVAAADASQLCLALAVRASPRRRTMPLTRVRLDGNNCMIASAVIDFPDPDAPTRPRISPAATSSDRFLMMRASPIDTSGTRFAEAAAQPRPYRPPVSCRTLLSPAQAIAKQVQSQYEQQHCNPWEQGKVRRQRRQRLRIIQHASPAGVGG